MWLTSRQESTPITDSDRHPASSGRYEFEFGPNSPYAHVVSLVEHLRLTSGVVIDLGCGFAAVAEPLSKLGLTYVGCDIDKDALQDVRSRGFTAIEVDLQAGQPLLDQIRADLFETQIGEVKVVLMLDVLEHMPFPGAILISIRELITALGNAVLIVSVPNVGHADVGAKLAFGRFDYTKTGLLDDTHLHFFTEARLTEEFATAGFREIARNDFRLRRSDQHFPAGHPALSEGAPLARLIRHWRSQVDAAGDVNQFVRAFAPIPLPEPSAEVGPIAPPPKFLSVLMRTQGRKPECLKDALTCLAAQTVDDFELKLLVHEGDAVLGQVKDIVGQFHPSFVARVEVIQVVGGGRGRPLNVGLERAAGEYVAFLDDDDLVTGDWVETFKAKKSSAEGRIIRSVTVSQRTELADDSPIADFRPVSGLESTFMPKFDFGLHFHANQSPICCFAVPRQVLDAFHLKFDEDLPVTEDWDFFLRAAQVAGVLDTNQVTSIYRRWVVGGSNGLVDQAVWEAVRRSILHRFDESPLLLPAGSATTMAEHRGVAAEVSLAEYHEQKAQNRHLESEVERLKEVIEGYETSLSWRVTRPVRILLHYARRLKKKR